MDRGSKKERVFGCGAKDSHPRLKGNANTIAGTQGLSPMDVLQRELHGAVRNVRTLPGTANLKNRG